MELATDFDFQSRIIKFPVVRLFGEIQTPRPAAEEPQLHFFLPPSSAIYMISCLKMKRFGAPSRVSRTIFRS